MTYNSKDSIANWMEESAVPALHVIPADAGARSKIGGLPQLAEGQSWPCWKDKPLAFLAQLDFGEMAKVAEVPAFPKSGRASFFYNQEQSTWGFDPKDKGSWVVLFQPRPSDYDALADPPDELEDHALYSEKPVRFHLIKSLPDYGSRIKIDYKALSDSDFDELGRLKSDNFVEKHQRHQVGGFPSAVQNDTMELECQLAFNGLYCGNASGYEDPRRTELESGAADWILLFQLDTDDDTGMMWGDVGTLYFWIRRQDLVRSDFSNVWMILQCC